MGDGTGDDLTAQVAAARAGCVIAAAGCGKTEEIARATKLSGGRRLILTHTHAGVDALRLRLKRLKTPATLYHLETLAGWCLRYVLAFPVTSVFVIGEPKTSADWKAVYAAATRLVLSGAVDRVLRASYCGVFVDEYQDCGLDQHAVVVALASRLPICVFGDNLQAIFDFGDQTPVRWDTDVFPSFPVVGRLNTPHRWINAGNPELAAWLASARATLEAARALDLRGGPISWEWLPDQPGPRQQRIVSACLNAMRQEGRLVVIADPKNEGTRAQIAKVLAKRGFSNIEPVDCKQLFRSAAALENASDDRRLAAALNFLSACMTGLTQAAYVKAVASRAAGGRLGAAQFGELIEFGLAVGRPGGILAVLDLFDGFAGRSDTHVFRREMFLAMRSALTMLVAGDVQCLQDALWQVQNRLRHAGRRIAIRSVGSTLLVKGLEFEHAVIVHSPNMNHRDWYVALTRASLTVKVLSPRQTLTFGGE
ncbi:AAA family ATPase [Phenylobacterium sp. LjRoot225]|uniref:UvrD-helicase domain-containing protein n=1 Tax=Phenylobacterium sp. LjRoot225 TaxID=3342285 RepID=UPI003ECFC7FC